MLRKDNVVENIHHLPHSQIHENVMNESGALDPVQQGFNEITF